MEIAVLSLTIILLVVYFEWRTEKLINTIVLVSRESVQRMFDFYNPVPRNLDGTINAQIMQAARDQGKGVPFVNQKLEKNPSLTDSEEAKLEELKMVSEGFVRDRDENGKTIWVPANADN